MAADSTSRSDLYPPIEPYAAGMLDLDGRHAMYWEQSGNPKGAPVVFLHGGPGAGSTPAHRRFFDPHHYRIIVFDQRGAGRSRPHGDLADNTTPHLIEDIERLRRHLGIDSWLVFGGSWGSTLALAYAETHAARCRALVLRGIFLCRKVEIDWFLYGLRHVFPEAWRAFSAFLPESERGDILEAYFRRLSHPDPAIHMPAARAWSTYEGACSPRRMCAHANPESTAGCACWRSPCTRPAYCTSAARTFTTTFLMGAGAPLASLGMWASAGYSTVNKPGRSTSCAPARPGCTKKAASALAS